MHLNIHLASIVAWHIIYKDTLVGYIQFPIQHSAYMWLMLTFCLKIFCYCFLRSNKLDFFFCLFTYKFSYYWGTTINNKRRCLSSKKKSCFQFGNLAFRVKISISIESKFELIIMIMNIVISIVVFHLFTYFQIPFLTLFSNSKVCQ